MADSVKVPILGQTPKGAVMAGGLAVVGVAGYLAYKHFTKPKTVATGAYGAYGGYGAYGQYGMAGFGYGSYGGGGWPFPYGYGQQQQQQQQQTITTNQEWFQASIASLGSTGTDHTGRVLSSYIFGLPIQKADQQIVQEAEAFNGPPPVAGVGGYPPAIHLIGNHTGGNGNVKNPPTGLKINARFTQADVHWNPTRNATGYRVRIRDAHNAIVEQQDVTGTSFTAHNLHQGTRYEANVQAEPAADTAPVARQFFTTHK
jgi:hypothetical protein